VPYFRRIDATSAYEYLEKRFNIFLRMFASLSFVLFQIGRMAIVMYLPALALSTMTSMSVSSCILLTGILTIVYCTLGGLEAVVWTDAIQSFVLFGGALYCLFVMINGLRGGVSEFISIANANDKFHAINWDFSKTSFFTTAFWVMIIGGIGQSLVPYVSDQAIVQRYMIVSDTKKVRDSFIINVIAGAIATFIFFSIGTALYVFYKTQPTNLDPTYQNDAIFPLFISYQLPVGLGGIVIAGIYAAAQSTVSGSIHSISTVVVTDFARRFSLLQTEKSYLNLARFCTFFFGTLGTVLALLFANADIKSLWEAFISVLGLFGGSMCGVFLLGMFTKRVGGISAFIGAVSSAAILSIVGRYTKVSLVLYATVGITACVLVGYLLSFIIQEQKKDLSGLTLYTSKQ
jgi:SSS family transporter